MNKIFSNILIIVVLTLQFGCATTHEWHNNDGSTANSTLFNSDKKICKNEADKKDPYKNLNPSLGMQAVDMWTESIMDLIGVESPNDMDFTRCMNRKGWYSTDK